MSSTISDMQKIGVALTEPDVSVEPGGIARLDVVITNRQETPDRLLVEIEGLDVEWYNIPVPAVYLEPGSEGHTRINFKVARTSENRAGSYPFVVRVKAMETGETGEAQAILFIKPFDRLEIDLEPRRAIATFFRPLNDFEVTVSNLGNVERTVELHASDPDDECAYEFDTDRVTLKPGQSETILLAARPKALSLIGSPRLYGFSVSARLTDDAYITAKTQGQIERHALISPLPALVLAFLVLTGIGIFLFRPTPPPPTKILAFTANPDSVSSGQAITLSWNAQGDHLHFTLQHRVGLNGTPIFDTPPHTSSGNMNVIADLVKTPSVIYYTLQAEGKGGRDERTLQVKVTPPPTPPKPSIRSFAADTTVVHPGDTITLSWEARNAAHIYLDPGSMELSPFAESKAVQAPQIPGDVVYKLRVYGQDPNMPPAVKSLTIHVVPAVQSVAAIQSFTYSPKEVYFGTKVHLRWAVVRAASITLTTLSGQTVGTDLPPHGSMDVTIDQPTTFVLTATDSSGKTITRQLTITPQAPPVPPSTPQGIDNNTGNAQPPSSNTGPQGGNAPNNPNPSR